MQTELPVQGLPPPVPRSDDYQQEGRKEAVIRAVARAPVRESGIRDIRAVFALGFGTIYKVINALMYDHKPKKVHYGILETDGSGRVWAKKAGRCG